MSIYGHGQVVFESGTHFDAGETLAMGEEKKLNDIIALVATNVFNICFCKFNYSLCLITFIWQNFLL